MPTNQPSERTPFIVSLGTYVPNSASANLLEKIGGAQPIHNLIACFYERVFLDVTLREFFRDTSDPHAERLANWIVEKMVKSTGLTPWSDERVHRKPHEAVLGNGQVFVVHDRSSAHYAAWNSPKRNPRVMGRRFKLHEVRVWQRLMFWTGRELGLLEADSDASLEFTDWFVRFIAHFSAVYDRAAPAFTRDSLRWSAKEENIQEYLVHREMKDITTVSQSKAFLQIPSEELNDSFPYE